MGTQRIGTQIQFRLYFVNIIKSTYPVAVLYFFVGKQQKIKNK